MEHHHSATYVALLQGSSLRSRLCCPGPSSLNRPHPSHSQAHHNFIAQRLICDAFAVRERLGDPRAVPGFHCAFHLDMPSPETPGSSTSNSSRQRCRHRPSPSSDRLGTPKIPAIRFAQGVNFVAYTVHTFATACRVACPPCTDPTDFSAVGDFYYQASNGSVALPVAGYNYNSDWTPLLVGLSPTGMAASLAAPELGAPNTPGGPPSSTGTRPPAGANLVLNLLTGRG